MLPALNILFIDDDDDVVITIYNELKSAFAVAYEIVDTYEATSKALKKGNWNLILCDYNIPNFHANTALELCRSSGLDTPFIFVSENISEECAIEAMILGARDFVSKKNLKRLIPAIERVFKEDKLRKNSTKLQADLKQSEQEIINLNQTIIETARAGGMADVATSILHNIGNVLNSVNVSLNLLNENLKQDYYKEFFDVGTLLKQHQSDLAPYLLSDAHGKLIPKYIIAIAENMELEHTSNLHELINLNEKVQHIKDIVASQQSFSIFKNSLDTVSPPDVVDFAIQISGYQLDWQGIRLVKSYEKDIIPAYLDKAKLVQVVVNLIRNAKDALEEDPSKDKEKMITVSIKAPKNEPDHILISVQDNGKGIAAENLEKIFTFGFSTKIHGHGIGLHSSCLAIKEMGGRLLVNSEGIGRGAIFTIDLPTKNPNEI
jgi:signal transduction histidine kinase